MSLGTPTASVSLVLHEYLAKYPTPEEAAKHTSEAGVTMHHFEEACGR
jgi:transitional endoplasmic reticulum ATPase